MTGMRMLGPLNGGPAAPPDPELNLDDPETNYMAMLKIRGDLSGKDFFFAFPGEAWGSVPGEGYRRLFKTFGLGAGRIEEVPEGWRIYNREVLYYMDLETGKVLDHWRNPFLEGGRRPSLAGRISPRCAAEHRRGLGGDVRGWIGPL